MWLSWLDNAIGFLSPERAYRREIFKQALDEQRNYDAGDYSRGNKNWRVTNQSAELTDRYSRDNVRARARDLERNSDMLNSITIAYKRNVVGGGYTLQARTKQDDLNKSIEKAWKKWCKKQNCDVTASQSFNQIIRMAVERKKIDGGILFVKRYTDKGFIPFQLQMIEVDELDISQSSPQNSKNKVIGGIEYNSYNKAVGYFIRQYSVDGFSILDPVYIDAKDVIFYFTKKRPSQLREMSDMSQSLTRIRDTNEFMTAVSVKERVAACLSVFIKKVMPVNGLGRTEGIDSGENGKSSYDGKSLTPGMIMQLNAGDEVQTVNPQGQASDASGFVKLMQRLIGAGQGISYEATSRDMSQSTYSSARQGNIEDGLTFAEDKELLGEIMDEIYETFIISCVLKGIISIKDFWENKDLYFEHEWIQAPKPWIDPLKESNANRIALQTGQKTFKQVAAENGKDWREQIDEIAEVLKYAETKKIDLEGVIFGEKKEKNITETTKTTKTETDD